MYTGKVVFYNRKSGYGFIEPEEEPEEDVFFSENHVNCVGLQEGVEVEYEYDERDEGYYVTEVAPVNGLSELPEEDLEMLSSGLQRYLMTLSDEDDREDVQDVIDALED